MKRRHYDRRKKRRKVAIDESADKVLLTMITILILFGVVMVYDATAIYALGILGSPNKLFHLQIAWVILGLIGFTFFYKYDYRNIKRIAVPLFLFTLVVLIFLAVIGILPCWVRIVVCIVDASTSRPLLHWIISSACEHPESPET